MIRLHPFDIFMMIDKRTPAELNKYVCEGVASNSDGTITIDGVTYQQTTEVAPTEEAKAYVG